MPTHLGADASEGCDQAVILRSHLFELQRAADDLLLALELESCECLPVEQGDASVLRDQLTRVIETLP